MFLAYLANEVGSYEVMYKARKLYSEALRLTGNALRTSGYAERKEILLAVLLLGLFEKLSEDEPSSTSSSSSSSTLSSPSGEVMRLRRDITDQEDHGTDQEAEGESKHLAGAVILCKLRGSSQFQDPTSISLFHQLSYCILMSSLSRRVTLPTDFIQLRSRASRFIPATDSRWRVENLIINFLDFRARLQREDISEEELLGVVMALQAEYRELSKTFPKAGSEKALVSKSSAFENPRKGKNNICTTREALDAMFQACEELMFGGQVGDAVSDARADGSGIVPSGARGIDFRKGPPTPDDITSLSDKTR